MRLFRYTITALSLAAIVSLTVTGSGCTFAKKVIAKDKLNQGAILYNQGRTNEAAKYFEDTVRWMPDNPVAWLYYGATLIKQYQVASGPEDRQVKVNKALEAYNKALELAKGNCKIKDNAIGYIAKIYDDMAAAETDKDKQREDQDKHREWLLKRAGDIPVNGEANTCATDDIKMTTYQAISVGYWNCAYAQSTRYADKTKAADPFHARNFYYAPDKQKFDDCLSQGLIYNEKALAIKPDYVDALSYKSLLLREKVKSTTNEADRKKYTEEADALNKKVVELTKQKEKAPQG